MKVLKKNLPWHRQGLISNAPPEVIELYLEFQRAAEETEKLDIDI